MLTFAREAPLTGQKRPGYGVRRSRFALALARLTNGANTAAWPRPVIMAAIEDRTAAAFSSPIRQYRPPVPSRGCVGRWFPTTRPCSLWRLLIDCLASLG